MHTPEQANHPTPEFVTRELEEKLEERRLVDNQENGYARLHFREEQTFRQPLPKLTPEQERQSKEWAAWLLSVEPNYQKFKARMAGRTT